MSTLLARELRLPAPVTPGQLLLQAENIAVRFGDAEILRGVDLSVRAGQVLALVGPNGAGKSTLLAALTGDVPATGRIVIDAAPLGTWTHRELAVRRAVLNQRIEVSFPFTARDVVRMGRAPWVGTPAEDWDDIVVGEAMAEADVAHLAPRVFNTLSGGERARAGLARVLAQEASLFLLDEPTAALDIKHQESVMQLVRDRAARGDGVVVVMHDLGLAAAYADEIAVMSAGCIAALGPPTSVLTSALLSEIYDHPIEVWPHPNQRGVLVIPTRNGAHS